MNENKRKCFKCGSTTADPDVVLYRFPKPGTKNLLRCELWAKYVFPNEQWSNTEFQTKLYMEHRMLCNKHFDESSFTNTEQKKLHRSAVPKEIQQPIHIEPSMNPGTSLGGQAGVVLGTEVQMCEQTADPSVDILLDITNTEVNKLDVASAPRLRQENCFSGAMFTANVIGKMDKLFDLVNSESLCPKHYYVKVNHIKSSVFYICVNRYCTMRNRHFAA